MFSATTAGELPRRVRPVRRTEIQVTFFDILTVKKLVFDIATPGKCV